MIRTKSLYTKVYPIKTYVLIKEIKGLEKLFDYFKKRLYVAFKRTHELGFVFVDLLDPWW